MTQFPHDEFVKDYLPQLLGDYCDVKPALEVAAQIKQNVIDRVKRLKLFPVKSSLLLFFLAGNTIFVSIKTMGIWW